MSKYSENNTDFVHKFFFIIDIQIQEKMNNDIQ